VAGNINENNNSVLVDFLSRVGGRKKAEDQRPAGNWREKLIVWPSLRQRG
jgi:hypothetical protein